MNAQEILILFDARKAGKQYKALCPAHNDNRPSLAIKLEDDRALIFCQSQACNPVDIMAAKGCTMKDLFFNNNGNGSRLVTSKSEKKKPKTFNWDDIKDQIVEFYDYYSVTTGELCLRVIRYPNKKFLQCRPTNGEGWEWGGTKEPCLYRFNEIKDHPSCILVEGERDVDALFELGLVASCCPSGAEKWNPAVNFVFNGMKICVAGDHDDPGRKHAEDVACQLFESAKSVKVIFPNTEIKGGDILDFIESIDGTTKEKRAAVIELIKNGTEYEAKILIPEENQEEKKTLQPVAANLAEEFIDSYGLNFNDGLTLRYWRGRWFAWTKEKPCFSEIHDDDIKSQVMAFLQQKNPQKATVHFRNNVLENLKTICFVPTATPSGTWLDGNEGKSCSQYMVMRNGILNFNEAIKKSDNALLDHSPKFFSINIIPYDYDPSAKCLGFIKFMMEIQPNKEARRFLVDWMAYCLSDLNFHFFLLLLGDGANGKSVYLFILSALLGKHNVSNIAMDQLGGRFNLAAMEGKLANICADMNEINKTAEGILKLITAGDPISIEHKFKPIYSAIIKAKQVFAANCKPHFADRSDGIWRRMILIDFPVVFAPNEQNPDLCSELNEELSGIFNLALLRLKKLKEGERLQEPEISKVATSSYQLETQPERIFFEECCEEDSDSETKTFDLYRNYGIWCKENGFKAMNETNFGKQVFKVFKNCRKVQRGSGSDRYRSYQGIKLIVEMANQESWRQGVN